MRILVVSDIHANWPALSAIEEEFDVCLCLGDLVDYGPDPVPCVRWAMKHSDHSIRGNHDHGVAQGIKILGNRGYRYLTHVTRERHWQALNAEERRYLLELPLTDRFVLNDKRYLLVHGSPRDPLDEYVLNDPEAWSRRLEGVEADIVCVGHSHMQFNLSVNGTVVLNPGSVGQPRDGDPRAAYAIIEGSRIQLKRIEYPVDEAIASIKASDLPEAAKRISAEGLRMGKLPPNAATPQMDLTE